MKVSLSGGANRVLRRHLLREQCSVTNRKQEQKDDKKRVLQLTVDCPGPLKLEPGEGGKR